MKERVVFILVLSAFSGPTPLQAQEVINISPEPFFNVQTNVQDALILEDGTKVDLKLDYFVAPSGELDGLSIPEVDFTLNGARSTGKACDIVCVTDRGPPKRKICFARIGSCGGAGGGGGTLRDVPILVELSTIPSPDGVGVDWSFLSEDGVSEAVGGKFSEKIVLPQN